MKSLRTVICLVKNLSENLELESNQPPHLKNIVKLAFMLGQQVLHKFTRVFPNWNLKNNLTNMQGSHKGRVLLGHTAQFSHDYGEINNHQNSTQTCRLYKVANLSQCAPSEVVRRNKNTWRLQTLVLGENAKKARMN